MSISLYRKYRPQTFSEVIGQKHIVKTLANAIQREHVGHAYLFTGPRGTGKTTLARIFAKTINCTNKKDQDPCLTCDNCKNIGEGKSLDIFEIDAASNTGVDNVRELRENVKFPPSQAKFKIYIIDEVHMLSTGAFNALLKTLEEPPSHVIFILATTEIHKVPETIISRCQRFDFTRLSLENIVEKLTAVTKNENVKIEKEALEMIAIASEGGMRDAESLLSQVISLEDKNITAKEVAEILGTTKRQNIEQLVDYILEKNLTSALALIDTLSNEGYDLEVLHKSLLNYLRQLMLLTVDLELAKTFSFELTTLQIEKIKAQAEKKSPSELVYIITCFTEIQGKIKSSFIPQLPLEIAIVKTLNYKENKVPKNQNNFQKQIPVPGSYNYPHDGKPKQTQSFSNTPASIGPEIPPISNAISENDQKAPQIEKNLELTAKIPAEFSLNLLKEKWSAISQEIKNLNHSLATALPSCKLFKLEKNTITIATKYPFHKDKLMESQNQLTVESAFAKILGFPVRVNAVTMKEAGMEILSENITKPETETTQKKAPGKTSSLLADAIEIMGGQIVE